MIPYPQQTQTLGSPDSLAEAETAAFLQKVYLIMSGGLGAALTALIVSSSDAALRFFIGNPLVFFGVIIAELVMVWTFSKAVQRLSAVGAATFFMAYAVLNGVTFSLIFRVYTAGSIASTFFVTAGTFGAMSAYGYFTKRSLASWGSFLFMGLVGLIIASIVNLFLGSTMVYWLTTFMGVLIFTGLTAYDTQRIKEMNILGNAGTEEDHKEAIHGALILYLDFINLFLYLLRFFGKARD